MEAYRSGHNGAVLKTVCLKGRGGSNPSASAKSKNPSQSRDVLIDSDLFYGYKLKRASN